LKCEYRSWTFLALALALLGPAACGAGPRATERTSAPTGEGASREDPAVAGVASADLAPLRVEESTRRAEAVGRAVDQGLISADDAALYMRVHAVLDERYGASDMGPMGADERRTTLHALVAEAARDGAVSDDDADRFAQVNDFMIQTGMLR